MPELPTPNSNLLTHISQTYPGTRTSRSAQAQAGTLTDDALIAWFIEDTQDLASTKASYASQLARLQWFVAHVLHLPSVRDVSREDFERLDQYLESPPADHIMRRSVSRTHPDWRPFRGPVQASSKALALTKIRLFYQWMASDDILAIQRSPFDSKRARAVRKSKLAQAADRYLTQASMSYIDQAIDSISPSSSSPHSDQLARHERARARWIFCLAAFTGLRASEIANARASMVQPYENTGLWQLRTIRKGQIECLMPLAPAVMQAWATYRELCGIQIEAQTPLVCSVHPKRATTPLQRKRIWAIVTNTCRQAAQLARENGDAAEADRLMRASTHWLRHTFATALMNCGTDIRAVQTLMDHANINTTAHYSHCDMNQLYSELQKMCQLFSPA